MCSPSFPPPSLKFAYRICSWAAGGSYASVSPMPWDSQIGQPGIKSLCTLAHAQHYANTVVFQVYATMLKTGQSGHMFPRVAGLWLHDINHLYAVRISSNRITLLGQDTHLNFALFYGHKRQIYKCYSPLRFFSFYLCFFLSCDTNCFGTVFIKQKDIFQRYCTFQK